MVPRVGVVVLPQQRWTQARERWRAVEELGFDAAWTYDHLAWRDLADEPWFAPVPTLTAAATVTSRVRLGTWVASPNYRHPVPFAKDLMTLDDVSGGGVRDPPRRRRPGRGRHDPPTPPPAPP